MHRGEVKKLLQLRVSGILVSSHQHKPPFFRHSPPLLIFLGRVENLIYFYCDVIAKWNKKYLTVLLNYVITPSENYEKSTEIYNNAAAKNCKNFTKNWKIISQWKSWKSALDGAGRLAPTL